MKVQIDRNRKLGITNPMIYGQFVEHFHRQVYGGIFDPGNPLSDENGFRRDVIEALKKIQVPILRWPGGCFASVYHWKKAVGAERKPIFDKAWRVEEPGTFGTDEYIRFCKLIGCEPYICTNAGTGTSEEMSDWVEYCNLDQEGEYAGWRIQNGSRIPHSVRYWSIGNENYDPFEMGSKGQAEWARFVLESAKMMKSVDPTIQLSAAALDDMDWNIALLKQAGELLDWLSLHKYWDEIQITNDYADYEQSIIYTNTIEPMIDRIRGLLAAFGLKDQIKIAFDEWNLRGWYHPAIHCDNQGVTKEEYLYPRDFNDENARYTMADAVFSACFLNACNRNNDIVKMANLAPAVNGRGCIYTWEQGIVLRSTYHVFDLYVNEMGREVIDSFVTDMPLVSFRKKDGCVVHLPQGDVLATYDREKDYICISVVNKSPNQNLVTELKHGELQKKGMFRLLTLSGNTTESYNDIGHNEVFIQYGDWEQWEEEIYLNLKPHSINVIQIKTVG